MILKPWQTDRLVMALLILGIVLALAWIAWL